jgi:methyltransferase
MRVSIGAQRWRVPAWYVALLAVVAGEKLRELAISRANEAALGGSRAASRTFPLLFGLHVGLVTLPLLEVAWRGPRRPRWEWAAVLAAATALRTWSIRSLGLNWNVRAAVPDRVKPVETGPYAYIRHPNYLALVLEFLAVPLIAGARVSAVVLSTLNAALLYDRIREEERLLDASPAYRQAFSKKARFVPGVF